MALLGAALLLGEDVRPVPDVQRADALRALELVGRRARAGRRPSASTSMSTYGAAWTASTWSRTPLRVADARAAISAIGWIVPTSLLASMIETRIVRSVIAASTSVGVDAAVAVDRQLDDLEPELLEVAQRVPDGVVLDGGRDDAMAARLAGPRGALEREVVRLGAAAR